MDMGVVGNPIGRRAGGSTRRSRWARARMRGAGRAAPLAVLLLACGDDGPREDAGDAAATVADAGPGDIFVRKGCVQCHSVSALDVEGAHVGPDLSASAQNVPARYGRELREYLRNPSGTMQLVLSQQIRLTPEEKDSIAAILEGIEP